MCTAFRNAVHKADHDCGDGGEVDVRPNLSRKICRKEWIVNRGEYAEEPSPILVSRFVFSHSEIQESRETNPPE